MNELTLAALDMARAAGALLVDAFGRERAISKKGAIDLVTSADVAAETLILGEIARRFPDHCVLAEETGAGRVSDGPYRWVIDPLDGTVNFAHGLSHFAVLLAVQERRAGNSFDTVSAVTFDPLRNEAFVAERGTRTTLNGVPVRVSRTARLIDSVIATGFGYDRLQRTDDNHAEFCRLNLVTQGVRRAGAAGLDLAYVACGRLDAYWEYRLSPWDVTGGCLLVTEAGGQVTGIGGEASLDEHKPSVAVSNGVLHSALLTALASAHRYAPASREGLAELLPDDVAAQLRA